MPPFCPVSRAGRSPERRDTAPRRRVPAVNGISAEHVKQRKGIPRDRKGRPAFPEDRPSGRFAATARRIVLALEEPQSTGRFAALRASLEGLYTLVREALSHRFAQSTLHAGFRNPPFWAF